MSGAPPKLEVVSGGAARERAASAGAASDEAGARKWPVWVLVALLIFTLVGLGVENRRATGLQAEVAGLQGQVTALEGELLTTREELSAHRQHLDEVRGAVEALSALVTQDPGATP